MGLFSDKCEKCGVKVKKRARFCSKCGEAAPGSWVKCSSCNKWIGVESEYCPHCKALQRRDERELIENNVIPLKRGVFAQRVDMKQILARLDKSKEVIVEHGTAAILMVDGNIEDVLGPGTYAASEGRLKKFISGESTKSLFVVNAGEIVFPYSNDELRSKEDMHLEVYSEVILQFDPRHAGNLISNVIKGRRSLFHAPVLDGGQDGDITMLGHSDFWNFLKNEFHNSIKKLCYSISIDDLIKNPDVRLKFEKEFTEQFQRAGLSCGMRLIRVSAIEFSGADYEGLREKNGEIELATRQAVLEKRARQTLMEGQKDKVKDEQELQLYLDQLAQEYSIDQDQKAFDLEVFRNNLSHDLQLKKISQERQLLSEEAEYQRQEEILARTFNINETVRTRDFERSEERKDVEQEIDLDDKRFTHDQNKEAREHAAKMSRLSDMLDLKERKKAIKMQEKRDLLSEYAKYSDAQLATILPPEQVEQILKVRQLEREAKEREDMSKLSPEAIMAMKLNSGDVAHVMTNMHNANAQVEIAKANQQANADALKAQAEVFAAQSQAKISEAEANGKVAAAEAKSETIEKANNQFERVLDKSLDANTKAIGNDNGTTVINNK